MFLEIIRKHPKIDKPFNKKQNKMTQTPGDIQYSILLSESKLSQPSSDTTDLLNKPFFLRGMKFLVIILVLIGLMIGKIWMTVFS